MLNFSAKIQVILMGMTMIQKSRGGILIIKIKITLIRETRRRRRRLWDLNLNYLKISSLRNLKI
jgi:hypothetical protein